MLTSRNFDFSTVYTVETADVGSPIPVVLATFNFMKWPGQIVFQAYDDAVTDGTASQAQLRLIHITQDGWRQRLENNRILALTDYVTNGDYYETGVSSTSYETNNIVSGSKIEINYRPPNDLEAGFTSTVYLWGCISKVGMT
jgi:hypothetical protein